MMKTHSHGLLVCLFVLLLGMQPATIMPTGLAAPPSTSQTNNTATPVSNAPYASKQKSPRATMHFFLASMDQAVNQHQAEAWERVAACLDLSQVNAQRMQAIASDLWEVIDRLEYIDWNNTHLPDAEEAKTLHSFTYFPHEKFNAQFGRLAQFGQIRFIRDQAGVWRFGPATVKRSHDLFLAFESRKLAAGVAPVAARQKRHWIRTHVPASLKGMEHTALSLEYWQWLGLFILILLGVGMDQLVRALLRIISRKLIAHHASETHAKSLENALRPVGLLTAAILWITLIRSLNLPDTAYTILLGGAKVFGVFAGTWGAWRITDLVTEILLEKAKETPNKFDDVLIPLIRKTIKIFILAFGLIYGAQSLDINIVPLITGLGIGGLAFAFAAKDTIENFFGSIAVILDRPFEVGDWVVINNVEGTVEELGFRSTRIRTFYNSQITVPNAALVRATVDNFGRRRYRRWKTYLGVQYDTPPEKMVQFVQGIRQLILDHPYTRKDYFHVYYNQFGPSSLNILLYVFHEVPDWSTELAERERLFIDIIKLAKELGVEFAFPTQTIHMAPDTLTALSSGKRGGSSHLHSGDSDGKAYT